MTKKWLIISCLIIFALIGIGLYASHIIDGLSLLVIETGSLVLLILNISELKDLRKKQIKNLLKEADNLYKSGQIKNSIKTFERVLKSDEHSFSATIGIGQCYRMLTEYDKAVEYFKKASDLKPDTYQPHYFLGMIYLQANRIQDAVKALKKAEKINSNFEDVYFLLGKVHEKLGKQEKALDYYDRFLEVSPGYKITSDVEDRINSLRHKIKGDGETGSE